MEEYRIESEEEVKTYLSQMKYALDNGAKLVFQAHRRVDDTRDIKYTNQYTVAHLFPDDEPLAALRRELKALTVREYIKTVKDIRFPNKSEMREFGKRYNEKDDVYIKIRVELLTQSGYGEHAAFVMSFHYAVLSFDKEMFPYGK